MSLLYAPDEMIIDCRDYRRMISSRDKETAVEEAVVSKRGRLYLQEEDTERENNKGRYIIC